MNRFHSIVRLASILLAFGMLASVAGAQPESCGSAASSVVPVEDGYLVELPDEIARAAARGDEAHLTLRHPKQGATTVRGRLVYEREQGLRLVTSQKLDFLTFDTGVIVELGPADGPFGPCWEAEFGASCWLATCAGTNHCVPGNGPGGFVCTCV